MGLTERLNAFFNRKSPQELLALYGEPRKIFELNDYFSSIDLVAKAKRYVQRNFRGKPEDPFPGNTGGTLWDAALGILFSEHLEEIEKRLKRTHRINSFSSLVWISNTNYDRKEYWREEHGHINPLTALQDEILPVTKHGQVWWRYMDRGFREPQFVAWPEIEEKFLPRSVAHYQAQYAAVVEANERSFERERRGTEETERWWIPTIVEFADGTTQIYNASNYKIENNVVIVTSHDKHGSVLPPIILSLDNIKSIRREYY